MTIESFIQSQKSWVKIRSRLINVSYNVFTSSRSLFVHLIMFESYSCFSHLPTCTNFACGYHLLLLCQTFRLETKNFAFLFTVFWTLVSSEFLGLKKTGLSVDSFLFRFFQFCYHRHQLWKTVTHDSSGKCIVNSVILINRTWPRAFEGTFVSVFFIKWYSIFYGDFKGW